MIRNADRAFAAGVTALALLVPLTLASIVVLLVAESWTAITRYGLSYFTTSVWDPVHLVFGAAAYAYGTLVTTAVAIALAVPVAIGAAVFLTEFAPRWLRGPVAYVIELLAYIPSIVYGLWGIFVLVPAMRSHVEPFLQATAGRVPVIGHLFSGPPVGLDLLTGGVILAIMILPILLAITRAVLRAVPPTQREAMIGLGATRWEAVRRAVLPYARPGIIGGVVLGVARAFGETMAVTLVVGNSSRDISGSLFTPGYTMASAIANQFTEADSDVYFSAIVEIALVLLVVALVVNGIARLLITRAVAGRPTGLVV
ncbi:MAG TPA: phosphate ABC transporter permease subunit PstC [Candidatus Limnocylindria bacterium]|nr:phosphate ABC transporter permease subunit PstC [Candidatus Limnocylindria bacterium]